MNKASQITKRQDLLKLSDIKRVWSVLPAEKKPQAISLLLLMTIGMMLEMLGVGMVLPIIALLTDSEVASKYPITADFLDKLGNPSHTALMIGAVLSLLVIYGLKNIFLAFLAWKQTRFVYGTQSEIAKKLFKIYLNKPYTFHLQRNSAELINNLQVELNLFIAYVLSPGMLLIAETLVIVGLVGLLLYFEAVGALIVFSVFLIVGGLFQLITKKRITVWGRIRQTEESLRMKHAQQGIGAIKDVKLYGRESYFFQQYANRSENSLTMTQRNVFVNNLTRLWLEILAILGLSLLCISMLLQGKPINEILPVLGLFAAVAFRLMPSMNRIITSISQLRFGAAVIDLIQRELFEKVEDEAETTPNKIQFEHQVALQNVSFTYPTGTKRALSEINLTIPKGKMIGFVGESGSGKSTLIDVIICILEPESGAILVDGLDIKTNLRSWQNLIGYVPQSVYLNDDTLRNNIAFGLPEDEIDDEAVNRAIKASQLEETVRGLPHGVNTILGERGVKLSGGQKQRIALARALYHDPDILVLDEATSALDNETERDVMNAIESLHGKKTILIIAHRLSTVETCDHIYRLESGRLHVS